MRRIKVKGAPAVYHCMSRTVNGERLFGDREKEMFRQMLWQVADFCGVEVLTYAVMSNHFHILLRVPELEPVSDGELLRRYEVLYPRPTEYQTASIKVLKRQLVSGGEVAEAIRLRLLARMGDVSIFMKTLKQRFSVWYNRSHGRFGTLWAERFKSVLVEGRGNPLRTMAAYIDLNPVRAGIVKDPKDYRFCGYAEALAGAPMARRGICALWNVHAGCAERGTSEASALRLHREGIFGSRAADPGLSEMERKQALQYLQKGGASLPRTTVMRCRVRYFTDGAILGSQEFVRGFTSEWQKQKKRKHPARPRPMIGAEWGDLAVINGLRKRIFS